MQIKKYIILGSLFILPLTMYVFFASGKDNFAKLPVLTNNITDVTAFKTEKGETVTLNNKITVLGFFGTNPEALKANAFNLAHKIYKKNSAFSDFQFLFLVENGSQKEVQVLKKQLSEIANPKQWIFGYGKAQEIENVFASLQTNLALNENQMSNHVFIIDKEKNLRGRNDDTDIGIMYGFDASDYSEINNKMGDDIKVILAEYRLALKKYKANREI